MTKTCFLSHFQLRKKWKKTQRGLHQLKTGGNRRLIRHEQRPHLYLSKKKQKQTIEQEEFLHFQNRSFHDEFSLIIYLRKKNESYLNISLLMYTKHRQKKQVMFERLVFKKSSDIITLCLFQSIEILQEEIRLTFEHRSEIGF